MKKYLNGIRYDTDTARLVGEFHSSAPRSDFNYYEEALFLKKSGTYFLYGEGGPASRYASNAGQDTWGWGEKILPLSFASAKEWAEKNLSADAFEAAFGPVPDDESFVALNTNLSAAANDKLRKMASAEGMSIRAMLESLIEKA